MSKINWIKELGLTTENLEDIRYTAYAYVRQGKYDIALSLFEALVVLDSQNAYDAQTLGAIFLELNQPQQALKWFEKALSLEANHPPTLLNLTKAFLMLGRREQAVKIANILKNDPNPAISSVARAIILAYS